MHQERVFVLVALPTDTESVASPLHEFIRLFERWPSEHVEFVAINADVQSFWTKLIKQARIRLQPPGIPLDPVSPSHLVLAQNRYDIYRYFQANPPADHQTLFLDELAADD